MTTHTTRSRLLLVPCLAALAFTLSAQYASASLSFAITNATGATSFTVPTSGGSYPLILYALIQDSAASGSSNVGGTDPNGNDGISEFEAGIDLTGGLVGLTSSANFTHTGSAATVGYQTNFFAKGTAVGLWGSNSSGTVGIGATNSTATTPTTLLNNTIYWSKHYRHVTFPGCQDNVSIGSLGANASTWTTEQATLRNPEWCRWNSHKLYCDPDSEVHCHILWQPVRWS